MESTRTLALIGLGPHAKRIYYPLIEKWRADYNLELALLVELEDQRQPVEEYLRQRLLQPHKIVYLPEEARHGGPDLRDALARLAPELAGVWGCVIATEPKAHHAYAWWAVEHGLHVLMDKPVTAFDLLDQSPDKALQLVSDYFDLREAAERRDLTFLVQTQRRAHLGYEMIHEYLREFLSAYEAPLTYIDIYHADGMWNMPHEYYSRENHPYKYGYGKIMHSGYHFIDLYAWFVSLNQALPRASCDTLDLVVRHTRPYDHMRQIDDHLYQRFFADPQVSGYLAAAQFEKTKSFGETDVFLLLQTMRDDTVISTGNLSLLQTSFSRRAWPRLPADTYKGNGRVRHERMTIQVGHLLNVQVHSYQSYEVKDWKADTPGLGQYDHFDISFYRNCELVGGQPFEVIALGDALQRTAENDKDYRGHNEAARAEVFLDFLRMRSHRAALAEHELGVKLTAATYYDILRRRDGKRGTPTIDLTAGRERWLTDAGRDHGAGVTPTGEDDP